MWHTEICLLHITRALRGYSSSIDEPLYIFIYAGIAAYAFVLAYRDVVIRCFWIVFYVYAQIFLIALNLYHMSLFVSICPTAATCDPSLLKKEK